MHNFFFPLPLPNGDERKRSTFTWKVICEKVSLKIRACYGHRRLFTDAGTNVSIVVWCTWSHTVDMESTHTERFQTHMWLIVSPHIGYASFLSLGEKNLLTFEKHKQRLNRPMSQWQTPRETKHAKKATPTKTNWDFFYFLESSVPSVHLMLAKLKEKKRRRL